VTLNAANTSADGPESSAPPFDPAIVGEMLRSLDKTVRAYQLYMHNNPTYLRSLETLRGTFAPIWKNAEFLTLAVSDTQFTWYGVPVLDEPEKASDSLPWTLYKDGVREITFSPGFEDDELEQLLAIIPRVRKSAAHEDDLLTILWEQEFACLTYRYVDVSSEPGLPLDTSAEAGRWPVTPGEIVEDPRHAVEEARAEQEEQGKPGGGSSAERKNSPASIVSMEDFDSTLYFLDASEIAYLRTETEREYATDLRQVVFNSLLDIFELQTDLAVRQEVAQNIDALTLHLLAGRQFSTVAYLLREIGLVLERAKDLPSDVRARFEQLPDRLSEPQALSQLLQAMDEAETLPPQDELSQLFEQRRATALGTVFGWLTQISNPKLRPLLEIAAERLAQSNTSELVRLISSAEGPVAMEAVRRAGGLKTAAAVPALARVLGEPYRELRVAAVTALVEIGTPGAMQSLEKALDDVDRDVRLAAVKALTVKAYKPALARATQLLKARELKDLDRTERVAIFELYGSLCGDGGVPLLDELLNGKGGLFSRKEDVDIRACAALALGKVGTQRAQTALQKAMGEKDVIVRTAVNRSLKGGAI
jgi:HEAT repeat protein